MLQRLYVFCPVPGLRAISLWLILMASLASLMIRYGRGSAITGHILPGHTFSASSRSGLGLPPPAVRASESRNAPLGFLLVRLISLIL